MKLSVVRPSVCLSVCLSVCISVCPIIRLPHAASLLLSSVRTRDIDRQHGGAQQHMRAVARCQPT